MFVQQGSEGLWLVDFDGYKNSGEGLKKNVADLLTLAHSALDELDNLQYFEVRYSDFLPEFVTLHVLTNGLAWVRFTLGD